MNYNKHKIGMEGQKCKQNWDENTKESGQLEPWLDGWKSRLWVSTSDSLSNSLPRKTHLTLHHQIQIQNKIAISNSLPKANTKTFTLNNLLPRQIHLTLQMHKYKYKAQSNTGAGAGGVSLSQRKPASSWANWNYQRWSQNISTGVKTAFWMLSVKIDNRWRLDFEPNIVVTKKRDETEVKHFRAALTFKRKGALT